MDYKNSSQILKDQVLILKASLGGISGAGTHGEKSEGMKSFDDACAAILEVAASLGTDVESSDENSENEDVA